MLKSTLTEPCLFFHLFLQSKMSFKLSHCFARISEDTNCDQRCTEMANVEEFRQEVNWVLVKHLWSLQSGKYNV